MSDVTKDLLEALRANHEWHIDHDDHDGYPGSDLEATNIAAIARAEAALAEPQPDADTPWRDAVIVELLVACMLDAGHEADPSRAVKDLIAYHSDLAVDPPLSARTELR